MWYHKDDKLGFNTINLCLTIKMKRLWKFGQFEKIGVH